MARDEDLMGMTRRVVFRHIDLGTATHGRLSLITDINLLRNSPNLLVQFPSGRQRTLPINALPLDPFRQREVRAVWRKFLKVMRKFPEMDTMHEQWNINE
jgi:hypothetical protein